MAQHSPIPTAHPSIPTATWTKVNTVPGNRRKYLLLLNEDAANTFRVETVASGGAAPTQATDGWPIKAGNWYEQTYDNLSTGDVYVYQASGGPIATLAVKEGV